MECKVEPSVARGTEDSALGCLKEATSHLRVAIVHDWLTTWAGAEKALAELLGCFPRAEIFTIVNFLEAEKTPLLRDRRIHTSFIQRLPGARKHYRYYLPLMPLAIEQFDLKGFDLIISSSHAVAKGIIRDPGATHICYCYSPIRYAWDMQCQYLRHSGRESGPSSWLIRWQLHRLRQWDYLSAQRVDHFVAISEYIQRRIKSCYRRNAEVIYPPVEINKYRYDLPREDFYLTASRMVPYKRIDLVIEAFNAMPDKQLVVIGDGPDYRKLASLAGANVTLLGYQPDSILVDYLQRARAFLFMAEEDFGILPVEAQAAGAPVIGYGVGGLTETTLENITGLWVESQTSQALAQGVKTFEVRRQADPGAFSPADCRHSAERFDTASFIRAIKSCIARHVAPSGSDADQA